jgi:hypothetical protein
MAFSVTHRLNHAKTWRKPTPHEDRPKDRPAAICDCGEIATLAEDDWTSAPITEADASFALAIEAREGR